MVALGGGGLFLMSEVPLQQGPDCDGGGAGRARPRPTPRTCPRQSTLVNIRQSTPESGLAFQVKVIETFEVVPFSLGSGGAE